MTLKLYFHPLASFCWKALIALYENDTPFEPIIVDLANASSRENFAKVWPLAKFPVLRDEARGKTIAEATAIIEYLDAIYLGRRTRFIWTDPERAWQTRMWDRVFDHYIHEPMQKIVTDRIRPEGKSDPYGVEQARAQIAETYALLDCEIGTRQWARGDNHFSLIDCAAAPALLYAETVVPIDSAHRDLTAYLDRLLARPSVARVLREAEPYFRFFPVETKPRTRPGATATG